MDDVGMANTVESNSLVLKIFNQGALKVCVRHALQKNVQRLDDDSLRLALSRVQISCDVNLGVTAAPQAVQYLVTTIEQRLLEFEFRHYVQRFDLFSLRALLLDADGKPIVANAKRRISHSRGSRGQASQSSTVRDS